MGNDGGSIPTRRELVNSPTRQQTHSQLRSSQTQSSHYHWTYCPLSKRPLSSPVVSDHLGWLYNKDAIIEWLLKGLEAFGDGEEVLKGRGIKGLKDVVSVNFQVSDESGEAHNGNGVGAAEISEGGERKERWVCPVTRKELGGGVKAVYIVPCGCAFAEPAIREVEGAADKESNTRECLQCGKAYNHRDVISINPNSEKDIERMKARLTELTSLGLTHSLKKAAGEKKRKKDKESSDSKKAPSGHKNGSKDTTLRTSPDPHSDVKTKPASNGKSLSGSIKNATTASLTNKVLTHEREMAKRRKLEMSDNVKSLFKSKDDKTDAGKGKGGGDFMTRGYSLG